MEPGEIDTFSSTQQQVWLIRGKMRPPQLHVRNELRGKSTDLTTGNTVTNCSGLLDFRKHVEMPTLEVYGGDESLMPSRMSLSLTSILSCTGVKWAWKAPRPLTAARPLEAVAATPGC